MLKGEKIYLRAIEKSDAIQVLIWENDPENWAVTETESPYTLDFMNAFIDSLEDVYEACQLRMMICINDSDECIGTIDLNEIDFKNQRANVGILIADEKHKKKGYARESLQLILEYAEIKLKLHNLGAYIMDDNIGSINLFESVGFKLVGTRKEWIKVHNEFKDEKIYQLCLKRGENKRM